MGALAIGLLATVDPFEQLKKGTDTSRRNTTTELYNAMIRYYAAKSQFPWGTSPISAMPLSTSVMTDSTGYLQSVISAGELKPEFIQLAGSGNLDKILITSTGNVQNVAVCFLPESKSFASEGNAKFDTMGDIATGGCLSGGGATACYWCIK